MTFTTCQNVAARMTDADLRAILNSTTIANEARSFEGRAVEGLTEMVMAVAMEYETRTAMRVSYAERCAD